MDWRRVFITSVVFVALFALQVIEVPFLLHFSGLRSTIRNVLSGPTAARTLIFTFDSREIVGSSDAVDKNGRPLLISLPSMTAALNLWYAQRLGASFIAYYAPTLDSSPPRRESPICSNSKLQVQRAASWCKLLAVWSALTSPATQDFENFVFIDSDAVFLRDNVSVVERHISALYAPGAPPIGFLYHHPQHLMPAAGYFFFRRGRDYVKNPEYSAARRDNCILDAFLINWWNINLPEKDLNFPWVRY